jgi:putative tryptophan/tyrosine transport system substrate-binding protein
MGADMQRREFITLLGGAAAWPFAARAQQPSLPTIGFLSGGSGGAYSEIEAAFLDGLKEAGFVPGGNVAVEYRWADGQYDRLPALAADLVRKRVAVIFASSSGSAVAAKAATSTIPIVFAGASDPVNLGLVPNLNRPGGNVTGVTMFSHVLSAKRLELLHQLVPKATVIAVLLNPDNPSAETELQSIQAAAHGSRLQTIVLSTRTVSDIDAAFASLDQKNAVALIVIGDPLFTSQRDKILALAASMTIPASYPLRQFADAGGLLSYGTSFSNAVRQGGIYAGRILKGEKPGELPVMLPTKFDLVINLKTAKALGLEIPPTLLALADEVIE